MKDDFDSFKEITQSSDAKEKTKTIKKYADETDSTENIYPNDLPLKENIANEEDKALDLSVNANEHDEIKNEKKEENVLEEATNSVEEKKKKSSGVLVGLMIMALMAIGVVLGFYFLSNNKITVTFKDNETVISSLVISKNEKVVVPNVDKEGYDFLGWYYNDVKVDKNTTFDGDVIVYAKWQERIKKMVITFDTDDGNPIEPKEYYCESPISLPIPKKDGNIFLYWKDDFDNIVDDYTDFGCKDTTIKAIWQEE